MKFLSYCLDNIEPFRILDKARTQHSYDSVISYIYGGTIRGMVVSSLTQIEGTEEIIEKVLDQVEFWNAYPMIEGEVALPSPKGFYEDKAESSIKSIFLAEESEIIGWKRAKLGEFAIMKDQVLHCAAVKKGESLQIDVNNEKIFRMEYVERGQKFFGYIASEDEGLLDKIQEVLEQKTLRIGSDRTSGYGKVIIKDVKKCDSLPYQSYVVTEDMEKKVYLMLLSDTAMYDKYGNVVGIDIETLEEQFGVKNLKIIDCSTSTIKKYGYNRTYGMETAGIPFYEKGSIFQLTFTGTLKKEKIERVCSKGIGIQKKEGCGHMVILKDYEKIIGKQPSCVEKAKEEQEISITKEDRKYFAIALYNERVKRAIEQYQVECFQNQKGTVNSQVGKLLQICMEYCFSPEEGLKQLVEELKAKEERVRKQNKHLDHVENRKKTMKLKDYLMEIIECPLEEVLEIPIKDKDSVMGIPVNELLSDKKRAELKLELIKTLLKDFMRKGGNSDERKI